jgi:4'-phosphopantetheinyl transferase
MDMSGAMACGEPGHTIAMPARASGPGRNDVHVWHAHVDDTFADEAAVATARTGLTFSEQQRFDRYHGDLDRRMFLLGRIMSRRLVGRALDLAPDAWDWHEGPHGRPGIADPPTPLHFNLAHSAGLVVCALATGREVGVDVEDLERPPTDPRMVPRYCAPAEAADIEAQGAAWRERFLQYWTLKEAYLKARGLGIALPLREICFELRPNGVRITFLGSLAGTSTDWVFQLSHPTARHLVAIAASRSDGVAPAITIEQYRPGALASSGNQPT